MSEELFGSLDFATVLKYLKILKEKGPAALALILQLLTVFGDDQRLVGEGEECVHLDAAIESQIDALTNLLHLKSHTCEE